MAWFPRLDDVVGWLERDRWQTLAKYLERLLSLDGRSGGQTASGGTAAGEVLELRGTTHATPGTVRIEDSALVFNEAGADRDARFEGDGEPNLLFLDASTDRIGSGTATPGTTVDITRSIAGNPVEIRVANASTTGMGRLRASGSSGPASVAVSGFGTAATAIRFGVTLASWTEILSSSGGNGLIVGTADATPVILGTNVLARLTIDGAGDVKVNTGNLSVETVGKGLKIKEGTNATMGRATLVAGTVVVNTTRATTTMEVFLSGRNTAGIALHGVLTVSAVVAGTSFTILSSNVGDVRQVCWLIVEPA